jgi:hypothetical protein
VLPGREKRMLSSVFSIFGLIICRQAVLAFLKHNVKKSMQRYDFFVGILPNAYYNVLF